MPILYLDEDLRPELANLLITPDRFVRSARDEWQLGAGDAFQLIYAAERGWTLVTCNRKDFHLLHDAWLLWSYRWGVTREHAGILSLDQGNAATAIVAAINGLLDTEPALTNAMFDWTVPDGAWNLYRP